MISCKTTLLLGVAFAAATATSRCESTTEADPYAWLEPVTGEKALAWVKAQDAATAKRLQADPQYAELYRDALKVLDNASRIPEVDAHGDYLYNLWQDSAHPRGLLRRVRSGEFHSVDTPWETVVDFDALSKAEGKAWSYGGLRWNRPDGDRCILRLSLAGGDAAESREFDAKALKFVEGGFQLPVGKSGVSYLDDDTLLVAADFGPGTMSKAGYPLVVKRWKRGTPLSAAQTLRAAEPTSTSAHSDVLHANEGNIALVVESMDFYRKKTFLLEGDKLEAMAVPERADVIGNFKGRLVLLTKDDWARPSGAIPAGSLVVADVTALTGGAGSVDVVLAPSADTVISGAEVTKEAIMVSALQNVGGRLLRMEPSASGWLRHDVSVPPDGSVTIETSSDTTGEVWVKFESFTVPPSLYLVSSGSVSAIQVKSQDEAFDGSRFKATQYWATSADGTKIPYYVVGPKDLAFNGRNPVWMFAYGGFGVSVTPSYSGSYEDLHGAYGKLWLERGGVFVLANLRGGGEFGPKWHDAAVKKNHYKAFEDFEAVARDVIGRGITSAQHLGIEGRSNGGLLVSSLMVRHPELYGAVVCGNPLIDMRRYSHLSAGASWIAEYGDPDIPDNWAYIQQYSPYQKVQAGMHLPPVLFYTTTHDDRVHPSHARKMAAKMEDLGYAVEYVENTEGGHHGSVTHEELATRLASTYTFLWEHLK